MRHIRPYIPWNLVLIYKKWYDFTWGRATELLDHWNCCILFISLNLIHIPLGARSEISMPCLDWISGAYRTPIIRKQKIQCPGIMIYELKHNVILVVWFASGFVPVFQLCDIFGTWQRTRFLLFLIILV